MISSDSRDITVAIDAQTVRDGALATLIESQMSAWSSCFPGDDLHVVLSRGARVRLPGSVGVHRGRGGRLRPFRVATDGWFFRKVARDVGADVHVGIVPSAAMLAPIRSKAVLVYDFRHELRPEQFSRARLLARRVVYGYAYRTSKAFLTISDRTRQDFIRLHDEVDPALITTALLGCDHVDRWRVTPDGNRRPYALAFGHRQNKKVEVLVEAWALLRRRRGQAIPALRIVGVPRERRESVRAAVERAGVNGHVLVEEWLEDADFRSAFAGAALIVFASDFEGFGMPAVEAGRLRIPLVVSPDPALREVTGGLATEAADWTADGLADATERALGADEEAMDALYERVSNATWERNARTTRAALVAIADNAANRLKRQ